MSASDGEKNVDTSSEKSEDDEKVTASFEAAEAYPSLMVQRVQEDHIEDKGRDEIFFSLRVRSTTPIAS